MITGFNTDVTFEGVTYHVQTEDKGTRTPLILSLVFDGGTILASKRSPYDDLLIGDFEENELEQRLQRQHKLICAAISAGRLEDLKRMSRNAAAVNGAAESKAPEEDEAQPQEALTGAPQGIPMPDGEPVWDIPVIEDVQVVPEGAGGGMDVSSLLEDLVLPPEAVEILGDLEEFAPLVDNGLKVRVLADEQFLSGERKNINLLVCRGGKEEPVAGASVMIKIIGSEFRPLIFHSKADSNGVAAVMLKVPKFRSGRAAILIRATIEGEETELRRVIRQEK